MRKVFLDGLPKWESGKNKGGIDWTKSVGHIVRFVYDDIEDVLVINNFNINTRKLTINYHDITYTTLANSMKKCQIERLIHHYKYIRNFDINKKQYIDLRNMPLNGRGFDWRKASKIKINIPFKYKGTLGFIQILEYCDSQNVRVKYENKLSLINYNSLVCGNIGALIGYINKNYIFNVGEIVNTNTGVLKIVKQTKVYRGLKGYVYACSKCGNIESISEDNLKKRQGCNVCANKKILKGYNDLWTLNPNVAKLLANKNDGYNITVQSGKKLLFRCPVCNHEKYSVVNNVVNQGFSCDMCNDNISYSEKIMANILLQSHIFYEKEKIFQWAKNKRYDFYIPSLNCIIEIHGIQHYKKSSRGRNLKQEQENDTLKEQLAKENNIKRYITIDARKSELEWVKNNILQSELNEFFDFRYINWLKCHKYACGSLVEEVCSLWNRGIENISKISQETHLKRSSITTYLKNGAKLNLCNYDPRKEIIKRNIKLRKLRSRKVVCANTGVVFDSITEGSYWSGLKGTSSIRCCCMRKYHYAGKHPETGEKLRWMYYEDYLKLHSETSNNILIT